MKANLAIKFIAIVAISAGLILFLQMIEFKIEERNEYRQQAKSSIAQGWSDQQLIVSPVLKLTLRKQFSREVFDKNLKSYVVKEFTEQWSELHLPDTLSIDGDIQLQERYKGIYKIPVYETALKIKGEFPAFENIKHTIISAQIITSFSDMRGISSIPTLDWNNKAISFETGKDAQLLGDYMSANIVNFNPKVAHTFSMVTTLRGLDDLRFVPSAKQVSVTLNSPWQHPYFIGRYLPDSRTINKEGFNAHWNMSEFSTSIKQTISACADNNDCFDSLYSNSFGVGMHNPIDIYQKTDRSLKYAFLFIMLTFVVFCLFEAIKRVQIHPIQYALVGAALALFYLLLIALSEHLDFSLAYLIATIACVGLIFVYLIYVFQSRSTALSMSAGMLALYGMLYMILKSEDYALLMGSTLTFLSLGGLMMATRHINWYTLTKKSEANDTEQESSHEPKNSLERNNSPEPRSSLERNNRFEPTNNPE